ncbi:PREDICTED: uncharacterized protein LOC108612028 isoform X2 [Drosophila arizonae]|uniref:Uncharacterized protein LOC108612028 isoform X1 n=1 Tax=Drosophila arizonae TaxID=7263 RepID=A0ABM1NZK9_DROAR|nr:PREDICTED: uncharacterized protein LOC108612028 isoform X1 [Drosophila arizonae]XP_017860395.1 PREDICTED: uncharacterized protein LOC108612028 isoform X2 [Drosophila arizonae]
MENLTASPTKSTTPKKRRRSEYHDPDYRFGYESPPTATAGEEKKRIKLEQEYQQNNDNQNQGNEPSSTPRITFTVDSVAKLKRFEEIVRAEFQRELSTKEQQLNEIDARLYQARQLLDKLRYHVVSEYYKKQQVPLTAADVAKVRSSDTLFGEGPERNGAQLPLHPAIKKIVGKRPVPLQLHLPERTAATLAKETIRLRNPANRRAERRRQRKIRDQGIVTDHTQEQQREVDAASHEEHPCTSKQAYQNQTELDSPSVSALNASRLNNKNKFHFVVGNTSKYLGGGDLDTRNGQSLVYKWLVYVHGKNLPQPLESYIKKVRFQLHHSYRPNDIVDVHAPPFRLTRRGWGEFPMRIQLYFQEHLQQKPVQLIHNIVLDKTRCGLHTMGSETTVEVWLRADVPATVPITPPPKPIKKEPPTTAATSANALLSPENNSKPRTISITQNKEELDDNLFAGINKIELSDDIEHIEPTVLVSEVLKLSSPKKKQMPAAAAPNKSPLPRNSIETAPAVSTSLPAALPTINGNSKKPTAMVAQLRKGNPKNVVFQKEGKLYIIDPLQSKLKQAAKQQSLLKPQLSLLKQPKQQLSMRWHLLQCIQNDHGYANMSSNEVPPAPAVLSQRLTLEQLFRSIPFQSMRSAVEFLLRRLPLANALDKGNLNGNEFPFGTQTLATFQAQPALRQRFFEFMRGRTLLRCMRQHLSLQHLHTSGKESFWSTREIVAFARLHGYTPPLKMLCVTRQKSESAALPLSERVQQQLQEDPQAQLLQFFSLTSKSNLDSWLANRIAGLQCRDQRLDDEEPIEVVNLLPSSSEIQRPANAFDTRLNQDLLYLPPPEELDAATQLVRDMCKDVGIILHPEQSVPGVSQSLALTLLAHVLRMFIEKLVRRSAATKLLQQQQPHAIETLPPPAANLEMTLLPHDIGRVIAKSAEFDFLGNSYLGVEHKDSQSDA